MKPGKCWAVALAPGLLTAGSAALAGDRTNSASPYRMMWGGGSWHMGPVMMLFFFAIAVALVVVLVRWLWPEQMSDGDGTTVESALTILEERHARGEIGKKEFEEKKRILRS